MPRFRASFSGRSHRSSAARHRLVPNFTKLCAVVECVRSPGSRSHSVGLKPELLVFSSRERLRNFLAGFVDCFVRGRRQLFFDRRASSGWEAARHVHAASWTGNRTHRRRFAQLFWRTCRSFKIVGARIHKRGGSVARARFADMCRIQGRRGRLIVARSIELRTTGQERRRQVFRGPLFTPVHGCSRNSWESQIVLRTRPPLGAIVCFTCHWNIGGSG